LKDEVLWKSFAIATQRLIELFGADAVKFRQVGIEHHLLPANEVNELCKIFWLERELHFFS
jgi:hypothetical protein